MLILYNTSTKNFSAIRQAHQKHKIVITPKEQNRYIKNFEDILKRENPETHEKLKKDVLSKNDKYKKQLSERRKKKWDKVKWKRRDGGKLNKHVELNSCRVDRVNEGKYANVTDNRKRREKNDKQLKNIEKNKHSD